MQQICKHFDQKLIFVGYLYLNILKIMSHVSFWRFGIIY